MAQEPKTRCPQCGRSFPPSVKLCPDDGAVLERESPAVTEIGTVLDGKYRLDAFLSKGGMGGVYGATHVMLNRRVAVKLINPELVTSQDVVRRFQREARATTLLNHPNIVSVYDLGQTPEGTLYIAMEYVDGPSLRSVIKNGGPVAPLRATALMRQLASALSAAHRQGIVHRDLKPHNVMITQTADGQEQAKLVDFGIAKTFDEGTQLTVAGLTLGTPHYMAPEQAEGKSVDARSDIYACGVILYEMLTGDVPFTGSSLATVLIKHISEAPEPPSLRNPHVLIPQALESIAMRCLAKAPAERFQTADELGEALKRAASSVGGAAAVEATGAIDTSVHTAATTPMPAVAAPPLAMPTASSNTRPTSGRPDTHAAAGTVPTLPTVKTAAPSPASPEAPPTASTMHAVDGSDPSPPQRSASKGVLAAVLVAVLLSAAGIAYVIAGRTAPPPVPASAAEPPPTTAATASPGTQALPPAPRAGVDALGPPASATAAAAPPQTAPTSEPSASRRPSAGSPAPTTQTQAAPVPAPAARGAGTPTAAGTSVLAPPPVTSQSAPVTPQTPPARAEDSSRQASDVMPENPAVFFQCAGAPEVCAPLRTAVDDAMGKAGLTSVRAPARADIGIEARIEILQERVDRQFGNTFAVRNYSIDVTGETMKTSETVPMPASTTLSFDPRYGSERATEKARVVASDIVDRIKAFVKRKRGG
jgi:serine/threonine-protein kinase